MGFKIRDKSLFWTRSGWKNNWEPRILNTPRGANSPFVMYLACRYDSNSFLRSIKFILFLVVQSYRNYSRICKQYIYGDKLAEQSLILELRAQFNIPFTCETPVELIKHGGVTLPNYILVTKIC
jgi:hypothetical protein